MKQKRQTQAKCSFIDFQFSIFIKPAQFKLPFLSCMVLFFISWNHEIDYRFTIFLWNLSPEKICLETFNIHKYWTLHSFPSFNSAIDNICRVREILYESEICQSPENSIINPLQYSWSTGTVAHESAFVSGSLYSKMEWSWWLSEGGRIGFISLSLARQACKYHETHDFDEIGTPLRRKNNKSWECIFIPAFNFYSESFFLFIL